LHLAQGGSVNLLRWGLKTFKLCRAQAPCQLADKISDNERDGGRFSTKKRRA